MPLKGRSKSTCFFLTAKTANLLNFEELHTYLATNPNNGLSLEESEARKISHGLNELSEADHDPLWKKFLEQFKNPLILLLFGSAIVSIFMHQYDDAVSIALAVLIVSIVAFVQEYRSEKSLEELSKLLPDYCLCIRNFGFASTSTDTDISKLRIPARELVPGDLIELKAGDRVPADIRLTETRDLRIDESGFTGEAHPVKKYGYDWTYDESQGEKRTITLIPSGSTPNFKEYSRIPILVSGSENAVPSEEDGQHAKDHAHTSLNHIAFMGTLVCSGKAKGLVIGTGERTEFGEIFKQMKSEQTPKTPLQKSMDRLGKQLSFYSLCIIALIILMGYLRGRPLLEMFTIGVSLAVAAIPEGLPIVVTVTLALGVIRMSKKRVIIKKLPTVETLGRVNVLCSDKTGTLTTNRMTVTDIYTPDDGYYKIDSEIGKVISIDQISGPKFDNQSPNIISMYNPNVIHLLSIGALCTESIFPTNQSPKNGSEDNTSGHISPTESAILAITYGFLNKIGEGQLKSSQYDVQRVKETPFSSERKYMQVVARVRSNQNDTILVALKGAPEVVINKCNTYYGLTNEHWQKQFMKEIFPTPIVSNVALPIGEKERQKLLYKAIQMSRSGLRVLAVAFSAHAVNDETHFRTQIAQESHEWGQLTFLGFVGIRDPVKSNVPGVIANLQQIGIKIKMITGDAKETACSVACACGLLPGVCYEDISVSAYSPDLFLSGQDLDALVDDEEEMISRIHKAVVFYRTSPIHKIKIVKALQAGNSTHRANVVAMTGDGINDALALKRADIGIAVMSPSTTNLTDKISKDENKNFEKPTKSEGDVKMIAIDMNDSIEESSLNKISLSMSDTTNEKSEKEKLQDLLINTNDACKEAADMLLLEGDLSALTQCVDEGKTIYENIRNFLRFQLSTSISALALIALSTTLFMNLGKHVQVSPHKSEMHKNGSSYIINGGGSLNSQQQQHHLSPLNAMQILWINIIMDGPPAQSLGVEPPDKDILKQPPRDINDPMLSAHLISNVILSALIIVVGTTWVFIREMRDGIVTPRDTTMTFTCFVLFDMFNALSCRSQTKSIFSIGFFSNRVFIYSICGSILAQILVVYTPFFQRIFQTEAIGYRDWIFLICLTSSVFWFSEAKKLVERCIQSHSGTKKTTANSKPPFFSFKPHMGAFVFKQQLITLLKHLTPFHFLKSKISGYTTFKNTNNNGVSLHEKGTHELANNTNICPIPNLTDTGKNLDKNEKGSCNVHSNYDTDCIITPNKDLLSKNAKNLIIPCSHTNYRIKIRKINDTHFFEPQYTFNPVPDQNQYICQKYENKKQPLQNLFPLWFKKKYVETLSKDLNGKPIIYNNKHNGAQIINKKFNIYLTKLKYQNV